MNAGPVSASRRGLRAAARYPVPPTACAALAWTGLGLAVAAPAVAVSPCPPLAKLLVLLAFASFGPGAAVLCHVRLGSAVVSWAMALVLSMSLWALASSVMVWTAWWHPAWLLGIFSLLVTGSTISCLTPRLAHRIPPRLAHRIPPRLAPGDRRRASGPAAPNGSCAPDGRAGSDGWPGPDGLTSPVESTAPHPDRGEALISASCLDRGEALASVPRLDGGITRAFAPRPATPEPGEGGSKAATATLTAVVPESVETTLALNPIDKGRSAMSAAATQLAGILILLAGTACWVVSVLASSTAGMGDYGLLSVMHPAFFVAVGLCVLGFLIEFARDRRRGWLLIGYLALMILILHGTVPLLVHEPEYAWTYKHIGVIELFRSTGRIENPNDLYQAWPSMFASVAQFVALSGADSMRIAAWAPVFFNAANCLPLFAIVRSFTSDRRLPYLTVFVFTCVNWVAQDYLSPQAFTYVLCLGALLVMLRWLRGRPRYSAVRPRWLGRLQAWLHRGRAEVPYSSRRARRTALASLYVVYTAVVASHQLSPYVVALIAAALVVLGLVRPWHVAPALLGIAVLYLLPNYPAVAQFGLFGGFNIFSTFLRSLHGAGPVVAVSAPARIFSAQVVQLLSVAVWGGAALAVVTSRKRLGPVAVPAVLAFAPFGVMFEQGYGGEAVYRVFLFSAPWCAYLLVTMVLRLRRVPRIAGLIGGSLVLTAAALASIQGAHGQLEFEQFSPAEVQAAQYVFTHVPRGSTILAASTNLPARSTANYGDFNGGSGPESLTDAVPHLAATVTPDNVAEIDDYCARFTGPVYVVFTDSMISYAHYFGSLPDGALQSLRSVLGSAPEWSLFYRTGDTVVYQFLGTGG